MSSYHVQRVTDQIVYLRLNDEPSRAEDKQFIYDLTMLLDRATDDQHFLVDFRAHIITDVITIRKLAMLAEHPRFGSSTAFGSDQTQDKYANVYRVLRGGTDGAHLYLRLQDALFAMEQHCACNVHSIEWEAILV